MKKILAFLIIFFSIFSNILAYSETKKDRIILNKFNQVIDKIYSKDPNRVKIFYNTVKKIKSKYIKKAKFYFLFGELEKYLEKKLDIKKKSFGTNSGNSKKNNLKKIIYKVDDKNLPKAFILKADKNILNKKKFKKITNNKKILEKKVKKNIEKEKSRILKTTQINNVLVKYIKKEEEKYIPKNTQKNKIQEIQEKFLVLKIFDFNILKINYFKSIKIIEITGLKELKCEEEKTKIFLENLLKNKEVELKKSKKDEKSKLKAEVFIEEKNVIDILVDEKICKK